MVKYMMKINGENFTKNSENRSHTTPHMTTKGSVFSAFLEWALTYVISSFL